MTAGFIRFSIVAFLGLASALALGVILRVRGHQRMAQVVWCVAILLGSVPLTDLQPDAVWARVRWVPFWPWTVKDAVVNILLYMPLGFFFKGERHAVPTVVGFAGVLSLAAECSQLFSHSRFPSTTDVLCNMIGAFAGVAIAQVAERRPAWLSIADALERRA